MPPLKLLQWQASIDPDLSMTTTRATSGCFCRSRTPMSTGSVSSSGVSVYPPAPYARGPPMVTSPRPRSRTYTWSAASALSVRRSRGTSTSTTES